MIFCQCSEGIDANQATGGGDDMGMINSIAKEYIGVIDRIRNGSFSGKRDLHWLEGQRGLLHDQLERLAGKHVTVAAARKLAARSR
jgi:hypothetical protein